MLDWSRVQFRMIKNNRVQIHLLLICMFLLTMTSANDSKFSDQSANRAASRRSIRPSERACNSFPRINVSQQSNRKADSPDGDLSHVAVLITENDQGYGYKFLCSGIIIEQRFILTAGHCVMNSDGKEFLVLVGVTTIPNLRKVSPGVRVKTIHVHPNFEVAKNDIAILELTSDLNFNSAISPACLDTDQSIPATLTSSMWCQKATIDQSEAHYEQDPYILEKSNQNLLAQSECIKSFRSFANPNSFCTTVVENICIGASGAGLVHRANQINHLVGVIILANIHSGKPVPPIISMHIAPYLDFIENIVWPNEK